jgi:hypothetical protein
MAWLALYGFAWNDYEVEAAPAVAALVHGDLRAFLELAPAYGGSLVLRAPFALLPGLWGGGELAVYRTLALPCLLAGAVFGVWLVAHMRALGHARLARAAALGLCVANPITLRALEIGHPEELLGAVLCVAAVLLAPRDRPNWAALLLGLAIANKQWALLAAGPVLLALPRHRVRTLLLASALAVLILAPIAVLRPPSLASAGGHSGTIFQPWQAWWFLGESGHVVRNTFGQVKPGYRTPPAWIGGLARPLIVALALPLTLLCVRRRRRTSDPLLLLALLLMLRCALDPWDTVYYALPFLFALLTWEVTARREPPVFSLATLATIWLVFQELPHHLSADAQSLAFGAVALPTAIALAVVLYAPRLLGRRRLNAPVPSAVAAS